MQAMHNNPAVAQYTQVKKCMRQAAQTQVCQNVAGFSCIAMQQVRDYQPKINRAKKNVIEKQITTEQTRDVQDAIVEARRQIDSFERQRTTVRQCCPDGSQQDQTGSHDPGGDCRWTT